MKKNIFKVVVMTMASIIPFQGHCCCSSFYLEADYLYWRVQNSPKIIPLVIEQPIADGPFDVVLGGKKITNDWHSGARFTLGYWFDNCRSLGAEINVFFLGKDTKKYSVATDANGSPRLRIPYFDVLTGLPDTITLATPGSFRAKATLKVFNRMQGAEVNVIEKLTPNCNLIAGFRYWDFQDSLTFSSSSPLVSQLTIYNNKDQFFTYNHFYGGQIGISFDPCFASFFLSLKGKIALGAMYQKLTIDGVFQTNEFTGAIQTFSGGYFALPSNIGKYRKTRFSVIPEFNANVGYCLTDCISLHAGYTVLYASRVLRASKQMSNRLNITQSANIEFNSNPVLVGEASPKAKLKSSGLWVQGLNVGLSVAF
jgi:hypothetical protein